MADLKRWFKVWTSVLVDMDNMPAADIGQWVRLGARIALVGNRGTALFDDWNHIASFFRVAVEEARQLLQRLPGLAVEEGKRHGKVAVTMKNWTKYQADSTQAERQRASRAKRRGDETRGDETRRDETREDHAGGGLSPEELIELYNSSMPDGHPKVVEHSEERLRKARRYLKRWPQRQWWEKVFAEVKQSTFLRHGSKEHPNFRGDFDWLLTKGKDGTENCVKTFEGKYRDKVHNGDGTLSPEARKAVQAGEQFLATMNRGAIP